MNETLDLFWGRALKIARHYDTDGLIFADLTGMADDFSASFHEAIADAPEDKRQRAIAALQTKLNDAGSSDRYAGRCNEAFTELAASLNRIPIY